MARSLLVFFVSFVISGCAATLPDGGRMVDYMDAPAKGPVEVVEADFDVATTVGAMALSEYVWGFGIIRSGDLAKLRTNGVGGRLKLDDVVTLEPVLLKDLDRPDNYGYAFKMDAEGDDGRASERVTSFRKSYFRTLTRYIAENKIPVKRFYSYEELPYKNIVEKAPAYIPSTYDGFKTYLDAIEEMDKYEGIWATPDRSYVVGLIRFPDDPSFKYKGYVIETSRPGWLPGELKLMVAGMTEGQCTSGIYYLDNKALFNTVYEIGRDYIFGSSAPDYVNYFVLVKEYPPVVFGKQGE